MKIIYTIPSGGLISFGLNFLLIESILIPDICLYHKIEPSKIFTLFYKPPACNKYHPATTTLNICITLIIGVIIGVVIFLKTKKGKANALPFQYL